MLVCMNDLHVCVCMCVYLCEYLSVCLCICVCMRVSCVCLCVCLCVYHMCLSVSVCVCMSVCHVCMHECLVWRGSDGGAMVESRGCWCHCSWRSDGSESPNISAGNWIWMLCRSKYSQWPSHLFNSHSFIFVIILAVNFWITEDRYRIQILVLLPNGLQITEFPVSNLEVHGHHSCSTSLTILFCFVFYFCPFYGCLNFL